MIEGAFCVENEEYKFMLNDLKKSDLSEVGLALIALENLKEKLMLRVKTFTIDCLEEKP